MFLSFTMDFRPHEALFFGDNVFKLVTIGFKFLTISVQAPIDGYQYGLLTKYQNLWYLSLTRNVKFRPVHLLVQWRLERRRLWRQ